MADDSPSPQPPNKRAKTDTDATEETVDNTQGSTTTTVTTTTTTASSSSSSTTAVPASEKEPSGSAGGKHSFPKQRFALLFGYCGTGYKGSQINPPHPTIEAEIMKAAVACGAVAEENADPKKVGFSRCARTDKGVHAAGNVVSLKLRGDASLLAGQLNAHLPPQIRVFAALRVTTSFHAKTNCGGREYEYCFPSYMLQDAPAELYPHSAIAKKSLGNEGGEERAGNTIVDGVGPEEYSKLVSYRVTEEKLAQLRAILKEYEGTHNFHNFTPSTPYNSKSSGRYMKRCEAADPFVHNGCEWVRVHIAGQSFMLHQIRKMVGLAILMVRTDTPVGLVKESYLETKMNIPKAPAVGLLLRRPLFDHYNKQHQKMHADRDPIEFEPFEKEIGPFIDEYVRRDMYEVEEKEHTYASWLESVDTRGWEWGWWLTWDGKVHMELRTSGEGKRCDEDVDEVDGDKGAEDD